MTTPANVTQLPDTLFRLNATNKLVIRTPPVYQAVIPITYQLTVDEFPDLKGVPDDEIILEQHLDIIEGQTDTQWRPMRDGYLYVFREDSLWAEYKITFDSQTLTARFQATDLTSEQGLDQRKTDDSHTPAPYILIPKDGDYQIAYSEGQWPWMRIQLFGGLHKELMVHIFAIPDPAQDPNLVDWSAQTAKSLRQERCLTQTPTSTPDNGLLLPLDSKNQQPTRVFPDAMIDQVPVLASCKDHQDDLKPEEWVVDWVLLPVKDPLLIGQQMSEHLKLAWSLLQQVTHNMQDPTNSAYPDAKFYESALLAYQVFYLRGDLPKGQTRWQQDQNSEEAFKHLSLEDIKATLAIDLRRVLYRLIGHWQDRIVALIDGQAEWKQWNVALQATLDDYWPMPDLPGPLGSDDEDVACWGYGHRRWYHLSSLLQFLGTPPHSSAKLIERDPISLKLAAEAEKASGPKLIASILKGNHPLSELVLNAPQVALYRFQETLVELVQLSSNNNGKPYDTVVYHQEQELLTQLRSSGKPSSNVYRNDTATTYNKQQEKDKQDKEGQIEASTSIKVSISTARLVSNIIGTMGGTAIKLTSGTLTPNQMDSTVERLRHLFNTVQEAHLKYTSFESIYNNKLEQRTRIIAEFLSQAKNERTENFNRATPDDFASDAQLELENTINDLKNRHYTERRNLKKELRDDLLPEYKKQYTNEQNQLRSSLADLRDTQDMLQREINQVLRQYNDGSGNISAMEAAASQDEHYQRLNNEKILADENYNTQRERWITLDNNIEAINQDIVTLKSDIENRTKSGRNIDLLDTQIEQDRVQYQRSHDPANPLNILLEQDQQHLAQRAKLEAETEASIAHHTKTFDQEVKRIEEKGRMPINEATPEGRELLAFHESQQLRLEQARDTKVITTSSETEFKQLQAQYDTSPNHIVLDEYQSTLWQTQFEGNYLVLEGGEHLYAADPAHGVTKNAMRDVSLSGALLLFDMFNLYNAIRVVYSSADNAKSGRNVTDLISSILGVAASVSDHWKLVHTSRSYLNNAEKLATVYGRVMLGGSLSNTAVNGARVVGYMGAIGAGLGVAVSFLDFLENNKEGDDAMVADGIMVVGGLIGFVGIFTAGLILGPISIVVGITGLLLKAFVFKEDNLLQTWLEQGPFSEAKPSRSSHMGKLSGIWHREITLHQPTEDTLNLPGFTNKAISIPSGSATPPTLFYRTAKSSNLKDEKGELLPDLELTGRVLGSLILDQNYNPLGILYSGRHMTATEPKFWLQANDNTIYIKHQSKLTPCAEIGKPIAANRAAVSQHLDNIINSVLGNSIDSDKSDRFSDRWWEPGDDEFTKPMTLEGREGTASLELLLNGLFPVKTKLSMQALDASGNVMQKRFGRAAVAAGYTPFKGDIESVRFIVEIDAPYFIEGQSIVELRITESLGMFGRELGNTDFVASLTTPKSNARLQRLDIKQLKQVSKFDKDTRDGEYLSTPQSKIRIIRTLKASELIHEDKLITKNDFIAWTRIRLNTKGAELTNKEGLFFPYRKSSVYNLDTKDNNITTWIVSEANSVTNS